MRYIIPTYFLRLCGLRFNMESKTELYESKNEVGTGIEHNQLEVRCTRNVSGDQFPRGVQDWPFTIGGSWAWVPNRSYFRVGLTLTGQGGTPPIVPENLALADNVCANMYNNCYFRAGQQDVSSIVSYLPQAAQVKNRLTKSGAWTRSVGKSAYGQDPSFASRINTISKDGVAVGSERRLLGLDATETATITIAIDGTCTLGAGYVLDSDYKIEAGDRLLLTVPATNTVDTFIVETAPTDNVGTGMVVSPAPAVQIDNATAVVLIKKAKTAQRQTVYVHWVPPVGIFDSGRPMGSGDYRVSLNPESNYKRAAVQALQSLAPGVDFDLVVEDISFFVSLVRVNVPPTMSEKLELTEIMIQTKACTDAQNNQLEFTVPPSCYGICVYVQGSTAGSATNLPPSLFKTTDNSSNQLENIQITYSNVSKPSTNWSSKFSDTENYLTQRYLDCVSESGLVFNDGGCETFEEYTERGAIVFYRFLRDRSDRSTHCTVNVKHTNLLLPANLHVAALYRRVAQVTTNSGRVVDVQTLSV